MDKEPFMGGAEQEPSRIIRAGRWISHALHEAREQLRTADLSPHEGLLRASAAPSEYLPKVPDYPPIHDENR
jgi:hypothetical protein